MANDLVEPNAPWNSPEHEAWRQRNYENALVDRYERGLPLSKSDTRDAKRIIRERAKVSA